MDSQRSTLPTLRRDGSEDQSPKREKGAATQQQAPLLSRITPSRLSTANRRATPKQPALKLVTAKPMAECRAKRKLWYG